jgi:hypothetical protein
VQGGRSILQACGRGCLHFEASRTCREAWAATCNSASKSCLSQRRQHCSVVPAGPEVLGVYANEKSEALVRQSVLFPNVGE